MNFVEGANRVWVSHPDSPEVSLPAMLDFNSTSFSEVTFDVFPEPFPTWLDESRLLSLHVNSPVEATLCNLLLINKSMGTRGTVISFQIAMIIVGEHRSGSDVELTELTLKIDGCSAWFGTHGFKEASGLNRSEPFEVRYEHVDDLVWEVKGGLTVSYGRDLNLNRSRVPEESLTLKESSRLTVEVENARPFDELLKDLFKVIGLLEFVTNESVKIESVYGKPNPQSESLEFNASWKQTKSATSTGYHWLTFFEVFRPNFGDHLQAWFYLYDKLPLALDLYRSCKNSSGLQVEFRYFSIVSALESLHRSLFEEDESKRCDKCKRPFGKSLEQRLKEIIRRDPEWMTILLPEDECKRVADTRNYLAHQTKELGERSFPSDEWFYWYRRLSMVFEFSILAQLPFQHPEALTNIIKGRMNAIKSGSLGEWNF